MPSRRFQLDGLDWKFLLARSAFLLLGTLATILLTVWVPVFEELDSRWSPILVMGITGAAEFINRWLKDNRTFYSTLLFLVAALFVAGGDAAAQSFSGDPLTPTLSPTKLVERGHQVAPLHTSKLVERGQDGLPLADEWRAESLLTPTLSPTKPVERGQEVAPLYTAKLVERGQEGLPLYTVKAGERGQLRGQEIGSRKGSQIHVPDRVQLHTKIVATLEHDVPEGAEIKSTWSVPSNVDYELIGDGMLIWAPPGKHELGVSLIWVQFELLEIEVGGHPRTIKNLLDFGQQNHKAAFTVEGKSPEPEPDDPDGPDEPDDPAPPDVPADPFDNLGQRVAVWARGLPTRDASARVYRSAAELLRADPSKTQNDVAVYVVDELKRRIDYEAYGSLRANINADLQQRWAVAPLSRGVMADYYDVIANGLEG